MKSLSYYLQFILRSYIMRAISFVVFLCSTFTVFSIGPAEAEKTISLLHKQLAGSSSDERSDSLSREMREIFIGLFDQPEVFETLLKDLSILIKLPLHSPLMLTVKIKNHHGSSN